MRVRRDIDALACGKCRRTEVVEKNEGPDHLRGKGRQQALNLESTKVFDVRREQRDLRGHEVFLDDFRIW